MPRNPYMSTTNSNTRNTGNVMRRHILRVGMAGALATVVVAAPRAWAQEAAQPSNGPSAPPASQPAPALGTSQASARADVGVSTENAGTGENKHENGGFLAAGKIGGIANFNHLDAFVTGGIELGYVLKGGNIALLLDTTYTAPKTDGSTTDPRMPGGRYDWEIRQKQLVFQPTFEYRFTMLSDKITPYAGIGPRIYLLEDVTRGTAGGQTIKDSFERSTKWGLGVPLGAELALGPGGLFAELLFQWGPLNHQTTGDTHLGSGSLFVGYRAIL